MMGRRRDACLWLFALCHLAVVAQYTCAQVTISSFETGLEGWTDSGFSAQGVSVSLGTSSIGATDGNQSLGITQTGDGFSWDAKLDVPSPGPVWDAFNVAAAEPSAFNIEYDVTFDTGSIPQGDGTPSYLGVSFWIDSDDGFQDKFNIPITSGTVDETIHAIINLADPDLGSISAAPTTFYQIGFSLNGDWGTDAATVYFDNIRLTPVNNATALSIVIDRDTSNVKLFNDTAQDVSIQQYSIESSYGALDVANWNSISASGSDPGGDTWSIVAESPMELTEAEDPVNDGFAFQAGSGFIDLGDIWFKSPVEDVFFEYIDGNGERVTGNILYITHGDVPYSLGDFNFDDAIDSSDWEIFVSGHKTDLSGLTPALAYRSGDMNGDLANDFRDFVLFEEAYDAANGEGALAALIPEPHSLVLLSIPLAALLFGRRQGHWIAAMLVAAFFCVPSVARAQLLNSWENGLEGWQSPNFAAVGASVSTANIGVTDGTQSLAVTQDEDGFSWDAQVSWGADDPQFQTLGNALTVGPELFEFQLDVSFNADSIPQNVASTMQLFVALNSTAGWSQLDNVAEFMPIDGEWLDTETIRVARRLSEWELAPPEETDFYQINLAMNGDWGDEPATFHFDNLRLEQVVFPATLTLEVDRGSGATQIINNSPQSITFDYYEITSSGGSLNPNGWNSLDAQDIDAVDGPDNGSAAGDSLLEGWDAAGGSSVNDLTEIFLAGGSTLANRESLEIGNAFNAALGIEDLSFRLRNATQSDRLLIGNVNYIGEPGPRGDFNMDGSFDILDADLLVADIASGANTAAFDLDGSGAVDGDDLDQWLSTAAGVNGFSEPYRPGDANLDGNVNATDLNALGVNWLSASDSWSSGDFDANAMVNASDLNALGINWQSTIASAADTATVPEPASVFLFVWAGMLLLAMRGNSARQGIIALCVSKSR